MWSLHEADDSRHLDDGEDKLGLTIAFYTTKVDGNYDCQEDCDKHRLINVVIPVSDRDRGSYYFQWQHY